MAEDSATGSEARVGAPSGTAGTPFLSAKNVGKAWNFYPLAPGLFGSFIAYNFYPLVDGRYALIAIVFLFFLLIALVRRAVFFSGIALAMIAAGLFLNGALDKAPPRYVKTTVIEKSSVQGDLRRGSHYRLTVASWRPGKSEENFDVDLGLFRRVTPGTAITVEVHKGFFGVPWYGNISAD